MSPSDRLAGGTPFTIRRFEASDHTACRTCVVELQEAERQVDVRLRPGEEMADDYLRAMHVRCREHGGVILVAEVEGVVAGLTMVLARVPFESLDEPPGDRAIIAELVVRSEFRGRGIGSALMHAAERYAREAGASELRISVLSENTTARRLYLNEGFAPYLETLAKALTR